MTVSLSHAFRQGPCLRLLFDVAAGAVMRSSSGEVPTTPGPVHTDVLPSRSPTLLSDYIDWTGGDGAAYDGVIPPHFFAQWGFPLLFKALGSTP